MEIILEEIRKPYKNYQNNITAEVKDLEDTINQDDDLANYLARTRKAVKDLNIDPKIAAEIIGVIKENIAATQAKDKERVLKTIHKDCPQLRSTIQGMDYVFANFDMVFDLEKIEVIELSGEDAKVYYSLRIYLVSSVLL